MSPQLRRSKSGDTIHASDCQRAGSAVPWTWAEGLDRSQILAFCERLGLRRCRVCDPLWENDDRAHAVHVGGAA